MVLGKDSRVVGKRPSISKLEAPERPIQPRKGRGSSTSWEDGGSRCLKEISTAQGW